MPLFIGGPLDGKWIDVADGMQEYNTPGERTDDGWAVVRYRKSKWYTGVTHREVYVLSTIAKEDTLDLLLKGYKPQNRVLTKDDREAMLLIERSKYECRLLDFGYRTTIEQLLDGVPVCGRRISLTIEPQQGE
jgi:hypothetical protein